MHEEAKGFNAQKGAFCGEISQGGEAMLRRNAFAFGEIGGTGEFL
jgi:hypothetical protein